MNDNSVLRDECFSRSVFIVARMKKCDGRRWMSDQIAEFLQVHIDKLRAHEIPGPDYTHYMPETGNIVETHVEFGGQDCWEKYLLVCRDLGRPEGWSGSRWDDQSIVEAFDRGVGKALARHRRERTDDVRIALAHAFGAERSALDAKAASVKRENATVRRLNRKANRRLNTCRQKERQWRAAA
jgi:hypothetical protein